MSDFTGYPGVAANSGPAPPPPPPPPVAGQVPALRISTTSEVGPRRGPPQSDAYEPPAAIQNAMMTKDKKPFTYTPGMGGKLDLSQIRSPRMARRVAKNANDEGIEGPPKVLGDQPDSPYTPPTPSIYSSPQVAVPVFPQSQQPSAVNLRNSCLPRNPVASPTEARPQIRLETSRSIPSQSEQTPTPPTSPTQVTLAKAPTPWMQKQSKPQDELPEWAKRPRETSEPQILIVNSPPPQQSQQQPSFQQRQQQPQQQQQFVPQGNMRPVPGPPVERTVPLRIEDRPSVFSVINEPGQHHQFVNSNPHHMSRWGNPVGQSGYQSPQTYVVPVQQQYEPPQPQTNHYNSNRNNGPGPRGYAPPVNQQQAEPGPLQSQSFRVLQKITDTYPDQVDGEQLRKLQLTEDDRYLMNKFKEQVDGETYLHQEEDPRYRGAAIPSRAFRYLQNMTDSVPDNAASAHSTSRPALNSATPKKPNRPVTTFVEVPAQPYVPASQQQVPEPKKYTGGAIPSRSFRILQQMTTPESIGCPWSYNSSVAYVPAAIPVYESYVTVKSFPNQSSAIAQRQLDQEEEQLQRGTEEVNEGQVQEEEEEVEEEKEAEEVEEEKEEEEEEGEEEEDKTVQEELEVDEHDEASSTDSSWDSESYLAYSTGLNPLNRQQEAIIDTKETNDSEEEEEEEDDDDSTDCEKVSSEFEDDKCSSEDEVTVSVSLPLKPKLDRETSESNDIETCVDFTLKRVSSSREIVDNDKLQTMANEVVTSNNAEAQDEENPQPEEEPSEDEDSGVVCNVPNDLNHGVVSTLDCTDNGFESKELHTESNTSSRKAKKYDRTQTHSRLFRLLSDEEILPPPVNCPAQTRRQPDDDSYYQKWKRYSTSPQPEATHQFYPAYGRRVNVLCPRTNSGKNIPRILGLRTQQPTLRTCTRPAYRQMPANRLIQN